MTSARAAAAVCLLAGATLAAPGGPPPEAEESPAFIKGADVELLQTVRAVAARVETLRGLRFASAPVAVRATGAERAAAVDAAIDAGLSRDRLAARGRAWSDIGWGSSDRPDRLVEVVLEDLEGMALPPGQRKLLVDHERLSDEDFAPSEGPSDSGALLLLTGVRPDEPLAAHYLVHALERGDRETVPIPDTTDSLLARAAWSEGTANLVALIFLFQGMGLHADVVAGKLSPARVLGGALLPEAFRTGDPVVRSLVFFVYEEGFAQVAARIRDGGWSAVNEAVRSRRTTRDLLHPDRAPIGSRSPSDPMLDLPEGYRVVDRDVLGEQAITTLVATGTGKDNLGLLAGDGWVGDLLVRYENEGDPSGGSGVTHWSTAWASPEDAEDFRYGMTRVLEALTPMADAGAKPSGPSIYRVGDRVIRVAVADTLVTIRAAPASLDTILESPGPATNRAPNEKSTGSRRAPDYKN